MSSVSFSFICLFCRILLVVRSCFLIFLIHFLKKEKYFMLYNVYSIRDAKTGFMSPLVDVNHQAATRGFHHSVVQSQTVLGSYAQDFDLYQVAVFDSESGKMIPTTPPLFIASGSDAFLTTSKEDA